MISLDLSRAFDTLPRWALQESLAHVGVSAELQAAVLKIHEECDYHITHGPHQGVVPMRKGVRQGCALSPCLYTIFTIWIFDTLANQTSQAWADSCVTLFADDSHLSWEVTSMRDIEFCCACLRKTFALFRSVGMQINPDKSKIILNLEGATARRWMQAHVQLTKKGPVLSVGTPSAPPLIPKVTSFVYLGIVASYQTFELQTARHRVQCAMANKQRLAKVLHAQVLSLGYRVRLYVACIRSAMFYGVHATGLSEASLHRLDQADARAPRAVARSPGFLTHESTVQLLQRLHLPSPANLPYSLHARDGMPECRHCGQRFTRVEGLKKHVKGSCSVLFAGSSNKPARGRTRALRHRYPHAGESCLPHTDTMPEQHHPLAIQAGTAFCLFFRTGFSGHGSARLESSPA